MAPPKPDILELGCAEGYMTRLLADFSGRHVVVDASHDFLSAAARHVPSHVEFHESLFESFTPGDRFDVVVMSYILEHVADPSALVARARTWLKEGGFLFAAVPNSRALSRQLGRSLGVVKDLYGITPLEQIHGHRRSYDRTSLDQDIKSGGGKIFLRGGLMMKPFSTHQMDEMLKTGIIGNEHLDALLELGAEYPDLTHTVYALVS